MTDAETGTVVPSIAIIMLNGASSSGKSSIARALQRQLAAPWLTTSVDDLIGMMPAWMIDHPEGIRFGRDGTIAVGPGYQRLDAAWRYGVAAMARHGAPVIVDDVLLGGAEGKRAWDAVLGDLPVLWVGVTCAPPELRARERRRGDRVVGQAETQAAIVHRGITYDLVVDTTDTSADACAAQIRAKLMASDC